MSVLDGGPASVPRTQGGELQWEGGMEADKLECSRTAYSVRLR